MNDIMPFQASRPERCAAILRLVISDVNARKSGPDVADMWGVQEGVRREYRRVALLRQDGD